MAFASRSEYCMQVVADLQVHSKYARAVSQYMVLPEMDTWARRKGIGLLATGDWTHPLWMREIKTHLEEVGNGFLKIKNQSAKSKDNVVDLEVETKIESPYFMLSTEVSCIYSQGGKVRRVHTLLWAPSLSTAEKINAALTKRGCNLMSDGRPIIGLSSIDLADLVFSIDERCMIIPAHAWTPWFALYGSMSGFDSIDEAFGTFAPYIYAVETGLSSDPAMNWRIKELDNRSIVSFSDAHSGPKMGREATVFGLATLSYDHIREAIMNGGAKRTKRAKGENAIKYTVEFYPEEGKYHYTGHRSCGIKQTPEETKKNGTRCPVCKRPLTVGVMHRIEALAGRSVEDLQRKTVEVGECMNGIASEAFPDRPPYIMLVPLQEILSEAVGTAVGTMKVQNAYMKLVTACGGEFRTLISAPLAEIEQVSGAHIAEGIDRVRRGSIVIDPGYDGVFGHVQLWTDKEKAEAKEHAKKKDQMSLF